MFVLAWMGLDSVGDTFTFAATPPGFRDWAEGRNRGGLEGDSINLISSGERGSTKSPS